MKYTEKFFKFPIRVYDGFSLSKAMVKEEKKFETQDVDTIEGPEQVDWALGWVKLPYKQIVSWMDYFSEGRSTGEVAETGFDMTMIYTRDLGNFESTWKRSKFEEEINKFYENNYETRQPNKF